MCTHTLIYCYIIYHNMLGWPSAMVAMATELVSFLFFFIFSHNIFFTFTMAQTEKTKPDKYKNCYRMFERKTFSVKNLHFQVIDN